MVIFNCIFNLGEMKNELMIKAWCYILQKTEAKSGRGEVAWSIRKFCFVDVTIAWFNVCTHARDGFFYQCWSSLTISGFLGAFSN